MDGIGLFDEMKTLRNIIPENVCTLIELLRFLHLNFLHLNRLQEVFPNVSIVLRIVLIFQLLLLQASAAFRS